MNYDSKQSWIEAVMADTNLTPATARYAFGIFKHMYGTKDSSFPGAKAISEATGLNDGHFWKYNRALIEAGYLEVTSRRGTSNVYRLTLPTSTGGNHLPPEEVTLPPQEVTPTSTGGTKTTKNTTKKTNKSKTPKSASAPVDISLVKGTPKGEVVSHSSFEEIVEPLLGEQPFSLTETSDPAPEPTNIAHAPETDTLHHTAERQRREQERAAARKRQALLDMGVDPDATW